MLRNISRTSPGIARIVFGGTRVDAAIDYVRKIAKWQPHANEDYEDLLDALDQAALINKARNDILHYGTDRLSGPRKLIISNYFRARTTAPEHVREFRITPRLLHEMTADCIRIIFVLYAYERAPEDRKEFLSDPLASNLMRNAWLYKPPPPVKRDHKSLENLPKRKRPRRSSQVKS